MLEIADQIIVPVIVAIIVAVPTVLKQTRVQAENKEDHDRNLAAGKRTLDEIQQVRLTTMETRQHVSEIRSDINGNIKPRLDHLEAR